MERGGEQRNEKYLDVCTCPINFTTLVSVAPFSTALKTPSILPFEKLETRGERRR